MSSKARRSFMVLLACGSFRAKKPRQEIRRGLDIDVVAFDWILLAEIDRDEDLGVVPLHQQCDILSRLGEQRPQLLHR